MPTKRVSIPYVCWVSVTVEADDNEEAIDKALEESQPMQLVGNGGCDKMTGVTDSNTAQCSIEVGDGSIEGCTSPFEIEVEDVE